MSKMAMASTVVSMGHAMKGIGSTGISMALERTSLQKVGATLANGKKAK